MVDLGLESVAVQANSRYSPALVVLGSFKVTLLGGTEKINNVWIQTLLFFGEHSGFDKTM